MFLGNAVSEASVSNCRLPGDQLMEAVTASLGARSDRGIAFLDAKYREMGELKDFTGVCTWHRSVKQHIEWPVNQNLCGNLRMEILSTMG